MNHSKKKDPKQTTAYAYALRADSQSVLPKKHRVQVCQKLANYNVQQGLGEMGISRNPEGLCHFHGVAVCGDVRGCPVCMAKIGEVRKNEILQVLSWHRTQNDGISVLVTFTCRHTKSDDLRFIVRSLSQAKRDFSSYAAVKKTKALLGYTNMISAKDTTYGDKNGWHPHYHDIWLIAKDCFSVDFSKSLDPKQKKFALDNKLLNRAGAVDLVKVRRFLSRQWIKACSKNGLDEPSLMRGFQIDWRDGKGTDAVGHYLTKWGRELATPAKKKGRGDSLTPFQILDSIYDSERRFSYRMAKLWQEYNESYFGVSSVYFGKGLKVAAGIEEIDDIEAAQKKLSELVITLEQRQMVAISQLKKHADVLNIANSFSREILQAFVDKITLHYWEADRQMISWRAALRRKLSEYSRQHIEELGLIA